MKRCRCSWPAVGPCSASKGHWGQSRQSCPATSKLSQSWQHELWGNCQGEHKGATCLTPRSSRRSTASIPVFPAPEFNFIRFHPNHRSTWAKKPNNALCVLCSVGGAVNKSTVYLWGSLSTFLKVDSHCLYFWPDSRHTVDIFNSRS